jgi:hypothetical protein
MKLIRILFILLVFSITLSACTSAKLADKYDENIVTERAKKVVEMINSQDYDKVNAEIRHDLQDQLTSDKLKDAIGAKLVEAGAFIEYQSTTTLGQKSKMSGEDYATVVLVGKYEESVIVFSITLDSNLDIVGLYVK